MKTLFAVFLCLFSMLLLSKPSHGQSAALSTPLASQIRNGINTSKLHMPKSVKRFYSQNQFRLVWTKVHEKQTFEAMMLLDCVLQYGLAHSDYHPEDLNYVGLQEMLNAPENVKMEKRLHFDIMLTDAMLRIIIHLRYGKLNPVLSEKRIDDLSKINGFDLVAQLTSAFSSANFTQILLAVQPKSKPYVDLQSYMRLINGQYVGDCYEVPESEVRKVAINMERLRWSEYNGPGTNRTQKIYLTCEIKDGLPVFYPDTRHLDPDLEARLYNTAKNLKAKPPIPVKRPNIELKKD